MWGVCELLILFGIGFRFVCRIGVVLLSMQLIAGFLIKYR